MNFADYVTSKRSTKKIPTDIQQRWQERVVARGLHNHGAAGARTYLSDYGKGIAAPKCIALARCAEAEGYPDMATVFWAKAYELETDQIATGDAGGSSALATPKAPKPDQIIIANWPSHLQPGKIVTMQPVDPAKPHQTPDWFVKNPEMWGQPKRDGQRLVIIGSSGGNYYQKRTGSVVQAPSPEINAVVSKAVKLFGAFILDTECLYLDVDGGEHRTGAQAATYNIESGQPTRLVQPTISIFDALMFDGQDLTQRQKRYRLAAIAGLVAWLEEQTTADFEYLEPAKTTDEKAFLVSIQKSNNREGEVWFHPHDTYHGGKDHKHFSTGVRTKHLTEREVVVTGLTPTTAQGRPFGAIEVSEVVDGQLVPRGCVGTGYTLAEMFEIAQRFKAAPLAIVVRSQGLTETGQLSLARPLR